jgi:hypothetical protein
MAFKGKPSINKRNREMALRERQQEKAARRAERSQTKSDAPSEDMIDPVTGQPLSEDEKALREFKAAMQERQEAEAADRERDLERKK